MHLKKKKEEIVPFALTTKDDGPRLQTKETDARICPKYENYKLLGENMFVRAVAHTTQRELKPCTNRSALWHDSEATMSHTTLQLITNGAQRIAPIRYTLLQERTHEFPCRFGNGKENHLCAHRTYTTPKCND